MSVINRVVVTTNSNGVSPTGFNKSDASTMFRKVSSLFGDVAGGGRNGNMVLSLSPVAAAALVTTVAGTETANDTLTVAGVAITLKASGSSAAANEANIAAGTAGTSISGASPAVTTAGAVLSFYVNVNGDGAQLVQVTGATGAAIASSLQAAIRALTAKTAGNATALSAATCVYTTVYTVTSGAKGSNSSVVITGAGAATLKLGAFNGGVEAVGTATTLNNIAGLINGTTASSPDSWNGICSALACGNKLTITAAIPGTIGNGLALAVSSTGSVMVITSAFGSAVAGTEGTKQTYKVGL
jgi:hypothetical protein